MINKKDYIDPKILSNNLDNIIINESKTLKENLRKKKDINFDATKVYV